MAQIDTNETIVKNIYKAIQNNDVPKLIAGLTPDLNWYNSNLTFGEKDKCDNNQSLEDILALLKNQWVNLKFENLTIQKIEENIVLATGNIAGRSKEEDKFVTKTFHHLWWLKNGKVVRFLQ